MRQGARDPAFPERFTMSSETARDPRWWGGEPVWITAMRQGQRAASMFWPGSEVRGRQPTYWLPFDDTVPNGQRVRQVLDWLSWPWELRPSLVTLYFSEVDDAGHLHGPESREVLEAAAHVDVALGELIAGVERLDLIDRTTFVIVSDHGMSQLSDRRLIFLDDYLDPESVEVVEWSPNLAIVPQSLSVDQVYAALRGRHPALTVYKREQLPLALHYGDNLRIPPVIGIASDGWTITTRARLAADRASGRRRGGDHGYVPTDESMHGLFVAAGPRVGEGVVVPSFTNIHVYEFLCRLMGLIPASNDGDAALARGLLKD